MKLNFNREYRYIPFLFALLFSLTLFLRYMQPIGVDAYYHLVLAEAWANGNIGSLVNSSVMLYPPLLHWLIAPSVWFGLQVQFTLLLQIIFYPLAVYCISKLLLGKSSLIIGLLVMGSYAFLDRTIQVNPQAIDFILFALAVYFSNIKYNGKLFVLSSVAMLYNHGFVALAFLCGLFIQILLKRNWKPIVAILVLCLPILIVSIYYLPSIFKVYCFGVFENDQEICFWSTPLWAITYLGLPILGYGAIIIGALKRNLTNLDIGCALSIASLCLLIIPWADRFVQYSVIPLSILLVNGLDKLSKNQLTINYWFGYSLKTLIYLTFIILYIVCWGLIFVGGYAVGTAA